MFDDLDQARAALAPHFDPAELDAVLRALVPAIVLAPPDEEEGDEEGGDEGAGHLGGTRLGGTPDLPPGLAWPRPPAPQDIEAIAKRGNAAAGAHMRRHLAAGLPYAFMAQIDLAEAAALGSVAADLPSDGRLLFFYDYATGPWDTGTRAAHVVWDRTPREDLRPAEPPADLAAAAERERAELAAALERPAAENASTVYGAPGQARKLRPVLRLPQPGTLEIDRLPELAAAYAAGRNPDDADPLRDAYDAALEEHDSFDLDRDRRQQLLGSPMPEQHEPRRQAARFALFGRQYPSDEEGIPEQDAIRAEARRWRLLLQVDLADWSMDDLIDGTVYLLIRAEDLAGRAFDGVVAVYQQT